VNHFKHDNNDSYSLNRSSFLPKTVLTGIVPHFTSLRRWWLYLSVTDMLLQRRYCSAFCLFRRRQRFYF